ncbi:MAG: CRTAC1 family protein [Blastocatellia bacterium]
MRGLLLLFSLLLAGGPAAFAQGVAVPNRPNRPQPKVKLSLPRPGVRFQDVAASAGLLARNVSGPERDKQYIIETTGSGVALFDYDNDGWLDIFIVNGTTLAQPPGEPPISHLYRNNHDGTFADVTRQAGIARTGWGQGVCAGDYDNDGDTDLFVTYWGQNALWRNNGDGTFIELAARAGLGQTKTRWGTGCSFLDYDKDGDLDLFVANYVDLDLKRTPARGSNDYCSWKGLAVVCGPRGLPAGTNALYRNDGNGSFTDVSEASGIGGVKGCYGFTSVVSDYDNDGWPDIYLACDSTPNILFHNEGNGAFMNIGILSGTAVTEDGQEQAGMGVAAGDYDRDGWIDLVKTNFADDTPTLYHNDGGNLFTDATYPARMGVNTRFLGWGAGFLDFDNDGWKDILMVNGHVYPEVDSLNSQSPFKQERVLFWNLGDKTFYDLSDTAGPGILDRRASRGAAFGDLDNDGGIEIVVNNLNDAPSLLKNFGGRQNWTLLQLAGTRSNRSGIGARVTITAGSARQMDEARSGGSFLSQNDLRLHFGLGKAAWIERAEVLWPSGTKEVFANLKANQVIVLREGNGRPLTARTAKPARK